MLSQCSFIFIHTMATLNKPHPVYAQGYATHLKTGEAEEVPGLAVSCELSFQTMLQVLPHPQLHQRVC